MDNVYAWRLGEAARKTVPGGDYIDGGWSLLKLLHEAGFNVVVREKAVNYGDEGLILNKRCKL